MENKYDDPVFFERYGGMSRSVLGLAGAGEWHELRRLLPPAAGLRALDLGCGYGWHCRYLAEQGAASVVGIDVSEKMLAVAREKNNLPAITYLRSSIEEYAYPAGAFDLVLSSLAFHYIESFQRICAQVRRCLTPGGAFVFSVEHPVFTAAGDQAWHCDDTGKRLHWPVDRYFEEGWREAVFLGEKVHKHHKTLATYIDELLRAGFRLNRLVEPMPEPAMLAAHPDYRDELRRPMMLLIAATRDGSQ